jgi:transcription antitermination factor NusG
MAKVVKLTEKNLVDLIEGIVTDAVTEKKKEWIAEQSANNDEKVSVLESTVADLMGKVESLLEAKAK